MNVLIVVPFLSNGGAEKIAAKWCYDLLQNNVNAKLLVHYRVEDEYDIASKIPIDALFNSRKEYISTSKIKVILKLRKYLKKQKNKQYIIPFLSHVGIQCSLANTGLNNYIIETIRNAPQFSPSNIILRFARNLSIFFAKGCIFQNNEQMLYFPTMIRKKGLILYNTVPSTFLEKYEKKEYGQIKNLIMVSRLNEQKNHSLMLQALSILLKDGYDLFLTIVGEGPEYGKINDKIKELQLDNHVKLYGKSNHVGDLLIKSDLYILTSNFEGMPNSLMEAMACGLPCISTDCPTGPKDLIDNGINGLLINCNDANELALSIELLINNKLAKKLGLEARKKIIEINSNSSINNLIKYLGELK